MLFQQSASRGSSKLQFGRSSWDGDWMKQRRKDRVRWRRMIKVMRKGEEGWEPIALHHSEWKSLSRYAWRLHASTYTKRTEGRDWLCLLPSVISSHYRHSWTGLIIKVGGKKTFLHPAGWFLSAKQAPPYDVRHYATHFPRIVENIKHIRGCCCSHKDKPGTDVGIPQTAPQMLFIERNSTKPSNSWVPFEVWCLPCRNIAHNPVYLSPTHGTSAQKKMNKHHFYFPRQGTWSGSSRVSSIQSGQNKQQNQVFICSGTGLMEISCAVLLL